MFIAFAYILYCAYLFAKQFAGVIGMVATFVIFGVFISSCIAFGVYVWRSFVFDHVDGGWGTSPH
jgi:hypothetical protein